MKMSSDAKLLCLVCFNQNLFEKSYKNPIFMTKLSKYKSNESFNENESDLSKCNLFFPRLFIVNEVNHSN